MSVKFKENVYSTVCYGCNFGCGVYMRELLSGEIKDGECSVPILNIDYRKASPVNQGKLCRFGVNLANTYCSEVSKVDGKPVSIDDAVAKAAEILKKADASSTALLSVGGTTNEEHLAFMKIGEKLGLPVSTGMTGLFKDIGKLHAYTGRGTTYEEIESASKIYLFVDPYVQYPLLIRRLVHAKEKGAEIVSFGVKELPIATKNVFADFGISLYEVPEFAPDADTVIISDLTPYTYAKRLAEITEIAGGKSKLLFMRPFMNSTGAGYLSKHTKQKSFDDIISRIETGDLKNLVCLDSDLIDICLNESIRESLENLEHLIVFASRKTAVCDAADVVIATEPFYKKQGSVMNAEGRLIQTSAAAGTAPLTGVTVLSALSQALGGSAFYFDALHAEAVEKLGALEDEYKVASPKVKSADGISKISDKLPDLKTLYDTSGPDSFVSAASEDDEIRTAAAHVYLTTPFLWNGIPDEDNYIEISRGHVKSSALLKGFTADVTCSCGEIVKATRFKVVSMADGYILSTRKQPFAKAPVTDVTVKRSPTKPKNLETDSCNIYK